MRISSSYLLLSLFSEEDFEEREELSLPEADFADLLLLPQAMIFLLKMLFYK